MSTTKSPVAHLGPQPARAARPAQRLLATASKLFAGQGIRAVGIDQILRDAGVAKASLYSTYGSKDALVLAYLADLDHADRNRWAQATASITDPVQQILAFFDLAAGAAERRDFSGCLYANAATELPGTDLPPVREHREWLRHTLDGLLRQAGVTDTTALVQQIQLLYDGALLGSKLERSTTPIITARELVATLIS